MNLFAAVKADILNELAALQQEGALPAGLSFAAVDVMPPREAAHGDMATNAAMVLAGPAAKRPREIAEMLAEKLRALPDVTSAEIAGPGFLNLRFTPAFWQRLVPVIVQHGAAYGDSALGRGRMVNVEYVSANPTGPLHVGHGRGAVYGDALASLLVKAGFEVTREYYINDGGAQVDVLARSVYLRYREACGHPIGAIPEGLYPGDYLIPTGQALAALHGDALLALPEDEWLPLVRDEATQAMLALIKSDLEQLGIRHDVFASERAITQAGLIEKALQALEAKGLLYTGVLEAPKGKAPGDWEARPQLLFRSTAYGDDSDRAVRKSDGGWTYFAPDIAYHYDKLQRLHGPEKLLVDVLGADHGGYAKRIQAAVSALSEGTARVDVKLCQIVSFMRAGEPVKMSKRKGTFMTVREVVEEVGSGVFRFLMLTRKNDAALEFDFAKVKEQSKENPVFYVQYAHARIHSALRLAEEQVGVSVPLSLAPGPDLCARLAAPAELDLIRALAAWPRLVESAALACEPHRIAFYLQELAAVLHGWWNTGNQQQTLRFIQPNDTMLTAARLALARACAMVLASGLLVLGVEPVKEMR